MANDEQRIRMCKSKKDFIDLQRQYGPWSKTADLIEFAAAYGFSKNQFLPLEDPGKDPAPIRGVVFENRDLFKLAAAVRHGSFEYLLKSESVSKYEAESFEQAANAGLALLMEKMTAREDQDPTDFYELLISSQFKQDGSETTPGPIDLSD